jgi:hypothetical protein
MFGILIFTEITHEFSDSAAFRRPFNTAPAKPLSVISGTGSRPRRKLLPFRDVQLQGFWEYDLPMGDRRKQSPQVPHPGSAASRQFDWQSIGVPNPRSPVGIRFDWSSVGLPHPESPAAQTSAWSSALPFGYRIPGGLVVRPLMFHSRTGPALPDWVPENIRNAALSGQLPRGVSRFDGPPPYGKIVVWVDDSALARDIQVYQEYPEDMDFYLKLADGDWKTAHLLQSVYTQYNFNMRYFVEEKGVSPSLARDEIRRLNEEVFKMVLEASATLMNVAAAWTQFINMRQSAQRIAEAAKRTGFKPKAFPQYGSKSGGSTSATRPPEQGATSSTRPPDSGATSATRPPSVQGSSRTNAPTLEGELRAPKATPRAVGPTSPLKPPLRSRHSIANVKQGGYVREKNSVVEAWVDMEADTAAINSGKATLVQNEYGDNYIVNGRTYRYHDGRLYPVDGVGVHSLSRDGFKALGVYNKFGDTPAAAKYLDNMKVSSDDRDAALGAWKAGQVTK